MRRQISSASLLFGLPLPLLPVGVGILTLFARWLGEQAGYLLGFSFHWKLWRLLIPRVLLGKAEFATDVLSRMAGLLTLYLISYAFVRQKR